MNNQCAYSHLERTCSLLLLGVLTLLWGCGGLEITSHWRSLDIVIDGQSPGWFASAVPANDEKTSVVAFNDGEYLYVGLRTSNRDLQRQVMRQGITWWFDREGGDQKKFGFHYPVGGSNAPGRWTEEGERIEGESIERERINTNELDLYVAGEGQPQRMTKMATGGIDARMRHSRDTLYYEIQVPLTEHGVHPFAIGVNPGVQIGIGLESVIHRIQDPPRGGDPGAGGGPPPEGSRGPGGRGGGGGGGRGRGVGRAVRPEAGSPPSPIKIWVKVRLAVRD